MNLLEFHGPKVKLLFNRIVTGNICMYAMYGNVIVSKFCQTSY